MFTEENLGQYAVLQAMRATPRLLTTMIVAQAAVCSLLGTGIGMGVCAIVGRIAADEAKASRMIWSAAETGGTMVVLVSILAALISVRPVLKVQPPTSSPGGDRARIPCPTCLSIRISKPPIDWSGLGHFRPG